MYRFPPFEAAVPEKMGRWWRMEEAEPGWPPWRDEEEAKPGLERTRRSS
jgi:hypothetical protein